MAYKLGLSYVYIGNVPGHIGENTYCHQCYRLLIERYVFDIVRNNVAGGFCPYCGATMSGKFAS